MCSHGDVIPDLVRRAQGRGMIVLVELEFTKGSLWTFTVDDGRIVRGDWGSATAQISAARLAPSGFEPPAVVGDGPLSGCVVGVGLGPASRRPSAT